MCLHFVLDGLYDEHTQAGHQQLGPGWGLFKPRGEVHWNEFRAEGATTLRIELDEAALPELTRRLPGRLTSFRSAGLTALARRAHHEIAVADELSPLVAESLAVEMLAGLARLPVPTSKRASALARRCASLLEARFTDPYRLGDAARDLGVDRTVLARAFRREYGCTVGEFIRSRRVDYVAERIRGGTKRSLGELAFEAGFSDQSHLTRSFRAAYGFTPGAWRRRVSED